MHRSHKHNRYDALVPLLDVKIKKYELMMYNDENEKIEGRINSLTFSNIVHRWQYQIPVGALCGSRGGSRHSR